MADKEQMSDEQLLQGVPYEFDWKGRKLKLGPLNEGVIGNLVGLCKSQALAEFDDMMSLRYPEPISARQAARREADEERFEQRMTTGYYQWGNRGMTAFRATRTGQQAFMEELLKEGGNPLSETETLQLMIDGGEKLGRVIGAIVKDSEFPNVQWPETETNPA